MGIHRRGGRAFFEEGTGRARRHDGSGLSGEAARGARNCRPMRTLRGGEGNFPPRKPLKRPETRK
jgi:hypothetical protein